MRSNVTQYELIAPNSLDAVLQVLADSPDRYTPIAGGTELMVALGAGRLQPKKLVSLWNLEELRFIEVTPDAIIIGAGSTFTDIRKHPVIADEFSILGDAASSEPAASPTRTVEPSAATSSMPAQPPTHRQRSLPTTPNSLSSPPEGPALCPTETSTSPTKRPPSNPTNYFTASPSHVT